MHPTSYNPTGHKMKIFYFLVYNTDRNGLEIMVSLGCPLNYIYNKHWSSKHYSSVCEMKLKASEQHITIIHTVSKIAKI